MPEDDIKIQFTGIRPGEKLVEDLFNDTETRLESSVVGVHTALSESVALPTIKAAIRTLAELAVAGNNEEIMKTLAALVPGYDVPKLPSRNSEAA
jgi:FlaA1/EpsC-like NDP-sugar epimerase